MGVELPLRVVVTILECCVTFSGVLSIRSFVLFKKFKLNLPYLDYNKVLQNLEIRHYGPVCHVSETGLYEW